MDNIKSINRCRKLKGEYYTPEKVAEFITEWAIRTHNDTVLEPSCGNGVFLKTVVAKLSKMGCSSEDIYNNVIGVELDKKASEKAAQYNAQIINQDFFSFCNTKFKKEQNYDVVVGNPPFIRYQDFNHKYKKIAFDLMKKYGFNSNKLSNIWLPFLVVSCKILKQNGRLGIIVPAELFQANYAAEARLFLSSYFESLTFITFKQLIFDNTQQEVIILLGERSSENKGIRVIEIDNIQELASKKTNYLYSTKMRVLDHSKEKWIKYYLTEEELELLEKLNHDIRISNALDLFEVNLGVLSGENDFFLMNKSKVDKYNLHNDVVPIISSSKQLKGIILFKTDFEMLCKEDKKVFLFSPNDYPIEKLNKNAREYIQWGESQGFDKNYKCRIRKRWYHISETWYAEAFLIRHANLYTRIVINKANILGTEVLYKIRFLKNIDKSIVAATFMNTYTLALSETLGISYGGGVLSFGSDTIARLRIPMLSAEKIDIDKIDRMQRVNQYEEILKYTDKILLYEGLGLTEQEVSLLHSIWNKMKNKRLCRKNQRK